MYVMQAVLWLDFLSNFGLGLLSKNNVAFSLPDFCILDHLGRPTMCVAVCGGTTFFNGFGAGGGGVPWEAAEGCRMGFNDEFSLQKDWWLFERHPSCIVGLLFQFYISASASTKTLTTMTLHFFKTLKAAEPREYIVIIDRSYSMQSMVWTGDEPVPTRWSQVCTLVLAQWRELRSRCLLRQLCAKHVVHLQVHAHTQIVRFFVQHYLLRPKV